MRENPIILTQTATWRRRWDSDESKMAEFRIEGAFQIYLPSLGGCMEATAQTLSWH
jgi:hypothetical protein